MRRFLKHRPSPATALAGTALFVVLGGIGFAAIPDSNGKIHACYEKKSGDLRVVDRPGDCRKKETALEWSKGGGGTGTPGPKGDRGPTGPAGATGPSGGVGPRGATGATGPQGSKGDRGDGGTSNFGFAPYSGPSETLINLPGFASMQVQCEDLPNEPSDEGERFGVTYGVTNTGSSVLHIHDGNLTAGGTRPRLAPGQSASSSRLVFLGDFARLVTLNSPGMRIANVQFAIGSADGGCTYDALAVSS